MNLRTSFNLPAIYRFVLVGILLLHLLPRGKAIFDFAVASGQLLPAGLVVFFSLFSVLMLFLPEPRPLRLAYAFSAFVFYSVLSRNTGLQSFDFFAPVFLLLFLSLFPAERKDLPPLALLYFTRLLFLTYSVTGVFKLLGFADFLRNGHSLWTDSFLGAQILLSQVAVPAKLPLAGLFLLYTPAILQNALFAVLAAMEFLAFGAGWRKDCLRPFLLFFAVFHFSVFFLMDINFSLNTYLLLGLYFYFGKIKNPPPSGERVSEIHSA